MSAACFTLGGSPQTANGWDPNGNGWDAQSRLTIGGTNVTLAGQTAPGAGVIFMGGGLKPQGNNNIIRNVTVASGYGLSGWWRPGDPMPGVPGSPEASTDPAQWFPDNTVYDAMDISGTNIMIDHVSTLYATDETISMNEVANNISVQYSNISQGQNYPQWDAEGGGLTGPCAGVAAGSRQHHHSGRDQLPPQPVRPPESARAPDAGGWSGGVLRLPQQRLLQLAGDCRKQKRNDVSQSRRITFTWRVTAAIIRPAAPTRRCNNANGGTSVLGTSSSVYRKGNLLDTNKDGDANDGATLVHRRRRQPAVGEWHSDL